MIGILNFDIKRYDNLLDEHMKSPSDWIAPFELLCDYWSNLSANYKKNITEFADAEFEMQLKLCRFFILSAKCYLLGKLLVFNLENREYKSYIQELLQLDYADDFRTTYHEFYSIFINFPVDWARVIINFLARNEKSYIYDRLLAAFENKNEDEFISLLNNIDITQCSKCVGYLFMFQTIYDKFKCFEIIDCNDDEETFDSFMYQLLNVNSTFILPHFSQNFGADSPESSLLKTIVEMTNDDEGDIETSVLDEMFNPLLRYYYWLLDAIKESKVITPKEKEWIRRIEGISIINEFSNTSVAETLDCTRNLNKIQPENKDVVMTKPTIEHLPLPRYFDYEKLKLLQAAIPNYIDEDETYFTFFFGGFGNKPNAGYKIRWKGANWEFAYFLKVLYAWDPELNIFHDVPFNWDVVQRIFISRKGTEMKSLQTISLETLEKGHETDCKHIKGVILKIICPDIA